jgi:hypothetical protein
MGRKREHHQNIETGNKSLGDRRLEGKTLAGHFRCDLHPLQRLYLHCHDEGGVVHLWTTGFFFFWNLDYGFVEVAICISLLFFIVLAPYELHNMIMAIFVSLLWWIFL